MLRPKRLADSVFSPILSNCLRYASRLVGDRRNAVSVVMDVDRSIRYLTSGNSSEAIKTCNRVMTVILRECLSRVSESHLSSALGSTPHPDTISSRMGKASLSELIRVAVVTETLLWETEDIEAGEWSVEEVLAEATHANGLEHRQPNDAESSVMGMLALIQDLYEARCKRLRQGKRGSVLL